MDTIDPQDLAAMLSGILFAAAVVLDDMQRTTQTLRLRIGPDAELGRLDARTVDMAKLLATMSEALRAKRAGDSLDDLADLILVEADDSGALRDVLVMSADSLDDLAEQNLDVA